MRTLTLFLLIAVSCNHLWGQQVTGFARDDQGKPLANASVALRKGQDSSIVKLSISNTNGQYSFPPIAAGRYFITITHIGYQSQSSANFDITGNSTAKAPELTLTRLSRQLKQVVVDAGKPLVEVKSDKVILNVENSINAIGSDVLELLRKSPGVTVDNNNTLSLEGKGGVQVFVDGRPTYLSGSALAGFLQGLPSSSVESIQIIAHPSARYEAAGSAGIIDIRLKKNKAFGTNMNVSAGYNIGTYGKYNGAFSFNHRDRHLNVFGDFSYNYSRNETYATMYRAQRDTSFLQQSTLITTNSVANYKTGLDWSIDDRNTLGMMISGSSSGYTLQTNSSTPIVYIPSNSTDRLLRANNHTDGSRDNFMADLNYRFADTSGHELNIDLDYGIYHLRSNQLQPNDYYDSTGKMLLYSNVYNILSPTDIRIYSAKADYATNFAKGRLGLGWKSSYVITGNDFQEYDLNSWGRQQDSLSSNDFGYRENINALYTDYKRTLKGWVIQGGLRLENTNSKGTSTGFKIPESNVPPMMGSAYVPYDSSFTRHYTDLFPSISLTWNSNPGKVWKLSYSRRIDRPDYQDLNPFIFKIDDYTFSKGNTLLLPQYANSVGLNFLYRYKLSATLNYSHTKDLVTVLADTIDASKLIDERENLASQDILSVNIGFPLQYKWYSMYASFTGVYALNKANFGPGRIIDLNVFNATVFSQHRFRLGRGWTGELTQYFTSPNIWQATLRSHSLWSLDAGLQKIIFNGNGNLKVAVSDIFHTLDWSASSDFAGQYIRTSGGYESRLLKLNLTYRFGNKQLKAARRHSNAAEEETKRVGNGGGPP